MIVDSVSMSGLSLARKVSVSHQCPEVDLLLYCTRPFPDATVIEQIQNLLQQNLEWDFLLQMVDKHRVMPLFYRNLNLTGAALPPEITRELRRRFFENVKRNLLLTRELLHLLQLFEAANIRVVPYKGTVLAATVYGKQALRQVWDLDVLITEGDVARSRELLLEEGYRQKETYDREQSFIHDERSVEVDLHWGLTPFYFPIQLDFDRLWQNRQPFSLAESTIMSFAPEDLLLILCVQVAKDCWERRQHLEHLAKVCDIAALLHTYPNLNWQQVTQQAESMGIERMVHFGLFLAQGLIEAELPDFVCSAIQADNHATSLAQQVCIHLFDAIDESFASSKNPYWDISLRIKQLKFYLKMRERLDHKAQHVWEILRTLPQLSRSS